MLKGVIFDVDGTLVDSNDAHALSWVDTLAEAGYEAVMLETAEEWGRQAAAETIGVRHDSDKGKASGAPAEILGKYLPRFKAMPGSRALVLRVRDEAFKVRCNAAKETS